VSAFTFIYCRPSARRNVRWGSLATLTAHGGYFIGSRVAY